ncbi:MAG TPA: hypothetical protein VNN10_12050 [Dehalococcoidia bacterium]|nr:hypothetical protein [Dehalococcoidia bacterium]
MNTRQELEREAFRLSSEARFLMAKVRETRLLAHLGRIRVREHLEVVLQSQQVEAELQAVRSALRLASYQIQVHLSA